MRKSKGITLVALVVTIIILLILVGISIATLSGSGLFENARFAKEKAENSQIKENQVLDGYEGVINNYLPTAEELTADKIAFNPEDSEWNAQNVKEALDYLYDNL